MNLEKNFGPDLKYYRYIGKEIAVSDIGQYFNGDIYASLVEGSIYVATNAICKKPRIFEEVGIDG